MKIGVVGLGNRIAHVFHELKRINSEAELVAYADPQPIGQAYAMKNNFFPQQCYQTLNDMIEKESLDLCFTSPPYFDTEKYSDEPTQSYIKYPTQDEWVNGFLRKTIENCYYGLKEGGYMLYNIANTPKYKFIEEETVNISKGLGFTQEETLQLTLSSVMGAGYKYEPIFVFKKE